MAKKAIIITTINPPTKAIMELLKKKNAELIIVGDKKTPADWFAHGATYISIEDQKKLSFKTIEYLPYNHYSRKMIGYLEAISKGCDVIYDTDDDNIPYENLEFPNFDGEFLTVNEDNGFVNVYKYFTDQLIWPRGLPLDLIQSQSHFSEKLQIRKQHISIWQGLADGEPDTDAIYRLTSNQQCKFLNKPPIILERGTISPINSQNTLFSREAFPLLYLPTTVTFRFTDILRGYIAQPILWTSRYKVGFCSSTVKQDRNYHNIIKDFQDEIPMYLHTSELFQIVNEVVTSKRSIMDNLYFVYQELEHSKIVKNEEFRVLDSWMIDIQKYV